MKYYLLLIIILLLSCSMEHMTEEEFNPDDYETPTYNVRFDYLDKKVNFLLSIGYTLDQAGYKKAFIHIIKDFVFEYIEYKIIKGSYNPEQIKERRRGDCCEFTTLFSWLCYEYLGIKDIIIYRGRNELGKHRYCYIEEYDFYFNRICNLEIFETYDFDTYFKYVEYKWNNYD